ncbi:hypothetical protein H632_c1792p1 [Helicosporidium sp. ATCC 50920]|nr:hypothetical protein H632_c1792p1 [Helicosporidium sp. ATCC 50920]|eukprot:KDD73842.1 hypothetical protein H632_c1792p1 [Helicosporidium sp. ATCC 50920]
MPPIIPFPMPGAEAPVADEPPADAPSGEAAAASTPGVGEAGAAPLERDLGDDEFGAGEGQGWGWQQSDDEHGDEDGGSLFGSISDFFGDGDD